MAEIVTIDPAHDITMQYMCEYRDQHVYSQPGVMGNGAPHVRIPFRGETALPEYVYAGVSRPNVRFVTASGHGTWKRFLGFFDLLLFDADTLNPQHVNGQIVHLFGCQAGAWLGLRCIQLGATAFWGYTVDFTFPSMDPCPPYGLLHTDPISAPFLELDSIIDIGVIQGRTADKIYEEMDRLFRMSYGRLPQGQQDMLLENFAHLAWPGQPWGNSSAAL